MPKRQSIIARAKKAEREVQAFLFPDEKFTAHAKRPALEDEDVRGFDFDGLLHWGEVKAFDHKTVHSEGGPWAVLKAAFEQCMDAIERNPHEGQVPRPFSVLRLKGTQIDSPQNLTMYMTGGQLIAIPLTEFRRRVVGE